MKELTNKQKKEILDYFGSVLINHVRDTSFKISMDIVEKKTVNPIKQQQYKEIANLTSEQKEAVCDLLSETISDTIYNFLDMFETHQEKMKLIVLKDGVEHDLNLISEKMGGEIAFIDEDGWIQKFSKIGRFVI